MVCEFDGIDGGLFLGDSFSSLPVLDWCQPSWKLTRNGLDLDNRGEARGLVPLSVGIELFCLQAREYVDDVVARIRGVGGCSGVCLWAGIVMTCGGGVGGMVRWGGSSRCRGSVMFVLGVRWVVWEKGWRGPGTLCCMEESSGHGYDVILGDCCAGCWGGGR